MADSAFVGRDAELDALWSIFGRVRAGSGEIVVLSGDPGMGKTRLAREFANGASAAGAAVAWGRCYEGEWTPPLTPWGEAVGDIVSAAVPADDLSLLSAILPQRGTAAIAPHAVHLTGGDERARVFDAATRILLHEARSRPLVVVLDDIQWADQISMELLRHVAFQVPRRAILLLVTHRVGEPDCPTYIEDALSWVRTEVGTTLIQLKGLDLQAVAELARSHGVDSPRLASMVVSRTAGNPFFVHELVSQSAVQTSSGKSQEIDIPENVQFVVGRRIQRLSRPAQALLSRAAVFDNGFDLPVLERMIDGPEDELLDALDETLAAGFLQPVPGRLERYDFVHAIVRECITAAWNPSRRVRLHRQAAEAIEALYGDRRPDASAEIAVQYHRSLSLPGAIAGLPHALQVVDECHENCTPEHAVTFLRIARDLSREGPIDVQAAIVGQLSSAEAEIVQVEAALATYNEYLSLAQKARLPPAEIAARLDHLARSLKFSAYAEEQCWRPIVERGLKLVGPEHGRVWARLRLLLDPVRPICRTGIRVGRWHGFDRVAVDVLRSTGDDDDAARSIESFDAVSRAETDEYLTKCRGWSSPTAVMYGLTVAANQYQYRHGAFRDARALWQELIELSARAQALHWQQQAANQLTYLLIAEGDFEGAKTFEAMSNELAERLGPGQNLAGHQLEMATCLAIYQGTDWAGLAEIWKTKLDDPALGPHDLASLTGAYYGGLAAYCAAQADDHDGARRILQLLYPVLDQMGPNDCNHNGAVAFAAGAAWKIGDSDAGPLLRRHALDLIASGIGDYPQTSTHLALGQAAAMMNRQAEAREAFATARQCVSEAGQAPLVPVIQLMEAEAMFRWGDPACYPELQGLLDLAGAGFARFAMAPWEIDLQLLSDEASVRFGRNQQLPAGVTDREADVLRLIAKGLSDRQISDVLYVSPRTVNAHVRNMLSKTGAANRVELAMWARSNGLIPG